MKRTNFFLVFLLGLCLFCSAGNRSGSCDRTPSSRIILEQEGVCSHEGESVPDFRPSFFILADF